MSNDITGTIERFAAAEEAAQLVGQYRAYRNGEEIKVEIYDRPTDNMYRYTVHAYVTDDPARHGFGNGGGTIEEALSVYHWDKLNA